MREHLQRDLQAAFDSALRDFQQPTPVEVDLVVLPDDDDDLVWVELDGLGGTGFRVEDDTDADGLLHLAADFLQDQVFDQLEETWGQARPPCPGHQHAAHPVLLDTQAWWRCPHSHDRLGRIGHLPA